MHRVLAIVVVSVLVSPVAADAKPKRRGKVERVERKRLVNKNRLRLCVQPNASKGSIMCVGSPAPASGEMIELFDFKGPHYGTARVRRSEPSREDKCQSGQINDVYYDTIGTPKPSAQIVIGIMGAKLDRDRAKLHVEPSRNAPSGADPGEQFWLGFDLDGNNGVDLLIGFRDCKSTVAMPSPGAEAQCLRYWVLDSGSWVVVHEDMIFTCR